MEAADQRRQHVAIGGVVVVARPMEIGGHQADRIKAVLDAQRLFPDRLLGELRVDAATAQEQQPPHPRALGRFDHLGLDLEVLQQKVRWVAAVGLDAADFCGGEYHHRGLMFAAGRG